MGEMSATVAEARAQFSKIAATVSSTGNAVTVFKNSKPFVVIAPVGSGFGGIEPAIDWSKAAALPIDERYGHAVLPAEWDDPEDDGLYDDLA